MKHILVTTDLSANSRAGLRFAINLAASRKASLTFLYVHQVYHAATWNSVEYDDSIGEDKATLMKDLEALVADVYKRMKATPGKFKCKVVYNIGVVSGIKQYIAENKVDALCIATMGAGGVTKLVGTTTSGLITSLELPVFCIPSNYRVKPLKKVLYATDMADYEQELKKVVAFAKPMEAIVEMLHMTFTMEAMMDEALAEQQMKKKYKYDIDLHYEQRDMEHALIKDLDAAINKAKPSVVVLFTHKGRGYFERLFFTSVAEQYSFFAQVPLLIYNKG